VALLLVCSGCTDDGRTADGRIVHGELDGPLVVAGAGGNSIYAPKKTPWVATFGWTTPCTSTGSPITIERMRYRFKVEPLSVRQVVFAARRWRGGTGFGSSKGTPREAIRAGEVRGTFLGKPEGLVVTNRCGKDTAGKHVQILTVLEVGARGAEIADYTIDYTSEGKRYRLEVDWQLVACGTETDREMCSRK